MVKSAHVVVIHELEDERFVAECSCGWRAKPTTADLAEWDGADHLGVQL